MLALAALLLAPLQARAASVTFTAVASGGNSAYGLGSDGNIYSWGDNGYSELGNNSTGGHSTVPVQVWMTSTDYEISLSETAPYTFPSATYGYATAPTQDVTVTNTGDADTGALSIALSGADAGKFQLSTASLASLTTTGAGSSAVFTVSPNSGLPAGTYTATVTVGPAVGNPNPIAPQSFDLSFTVDPATPAAADFSFAPTSVTYDGSPHGVTVEVAPTITGMGAVTVYYSGATTPPTDAGTYPITIDVAAARTGRRRR